MCAQMFWTEGEAIKLYSMLIFTVISEILHYKSYGKAKKLEYV